MSTPHSSSPQRKRLPEDARSVLDWAREAGESDRVIGDLQRILRRRRQRRWRASVVAGVALFLVTGWFWAPWRPPAPSHEDRGTAVVVRPEARTLGDGSVVELAHEADLSVEFSTAERRVILRRGAAHFAVAKNAARPFIVVTDAIEVRAVGTAFAVEVGARAVEVVVTEGRVSLSAARPDEPALAALGAGGMAVVEPGGGPPRVSSLSDDEMRARLAWRVPRLEFSDTTLVETLAMWNEHATARHEARLVLAEPAPAGARVSGVLRVDDRESLLRLLEGEFGLIAERHDGDIRLRRR